MRGIAFGVRRSIDIHLPFGRMSFIGIVRASASSGFSNLGKVQAGFSVEENAHVPNLQIAEFSFLDG